MLKSNQLVILLFTWTRNNFLTLKFEHSVWLDWMFEEIWGLSALWLEYKNIHKYKYEQI